MAVTKRSRSISVCFRATPEERNKITENMKRAGIRSLRAYLLKMALNGYVIRLDLSELREMVSLLRNATSNLNQIVRRANETRNIYEADLLDLQTNYDRLWEQAGKVLAQLSKL